MKINRSGIKFNKVDKALMYSGVDFESKIREKSKSIIITDGKIKGFVKEYQDKKSKAKQMRPRQFIGLVQWNLKAINKDKDRDSVHLAVNDIATNQMVKENKLKEGKYGKFLMLFHKLGQFFQGHGFQRESKYIRSLANKIEPVMGIVVTKSAQRVESTFAKATPKAPGKPTAEISAEKLAEAEKNLKPPPESGE